MFFLLKDRLRSASVSTESLFISLNDSVELKTAGLIMILFAEQAETSRLVLAKKGTSAVCLPRAGISEESGTVSHDMQVLKLTEHIVTLFGLLCYIIRQMLQI